MILSHLCCIGGGGLVAPVVSGFLINNKFLMPFLCVSLTASVTGLLFSYLRHKNIVPLLISVVGAAIILVFVFFSHIEILLYLGLAGLIGASVYNMSYLKKCAC